jgi:hypothetical protein
LPIGNPPDAGADNTDSTPPLEAELDRRDFQFSSQCDTFRAHFANILVLGGSLVLSDNLRQVVAGAA